MLSLRTASEPNPASLSIATPASDRSRSSDMPT